MHHAIYTVSLGAQTEEEKKDRENDSKKLFTKKFPISPAILQEQTEQKQTFGVSSSSLSKSSVITLKLSLKIKVIILLIVSSCICVALYNLKSISSAIIRSLMMTPCLTQFYSHLQMSHRKS